MNSNRKITIGLLWHSLTSGNLGVGALTESNVAIIREIADDLGLQVHFVVLGVNDERLPEYEAELKALGHSIETRKVRLFRSKYIHDVRSCDLILDIGAGDSFADIYGFSRFFFYWLSKVLAVVARRPIVLSPQTIGPFDGLLARFLARQAMHLCEKVFTRDDLSTAYLTKAGIIGNIDEAVDVAFKLPYIRSDFSGNGKINVGINISGLLFNGGYTGANQFGLSVDYPKLIRAILRDLTGRENVLVHLVSHVLEPHMPIEDDIAVSTQLAKEFPSVVIAPPFKRPSEAKSYIAGLDFFAGARMHACIAAFSSGIPVIPMAYSRKFNGLFGSLGYNAISDLKKLSTDEAFRAVTQGFEQRDQLKLEVASGNALAKSKMGSYEKFLKEWLKNFQTN